MSRRVYPNPLAVLYTKIRISAIERDYTFKRFWFRGKSKHAPIVEYREIHVGNADPV